MCRHFSKRNYLKNGARPELCFGRSDLKKPWKGFSEVPKEYLSLKEKGLFNKELYLALNDRYHSKNIELINEGLHKIKNSFGEKLIFLDISGDFIFFKEWANPVNGKYIFADARDKKGPVPALREAIASLQEKNGIILEEELPANHEKLIEPVPTLKSEKKTNALPFAVRNAGNNSSPAIKSVSIYKTIEEKK